MKTKVWMLAAVLVASMWTMTAAALTAVDRDRGNCCTDKSCCTDPCC